MGDWWIDETPPVGPSEFDRNQTLDLSGLVISPHLKKMIEKWAAQIASYSSSTPGTPASAGTHVGYSGRQGGKGIMGQHLHIIWRDEVLPAVTSATKAVEDLNRTLEPDQGSDGGRVNNTGPRRGSAFGRRGRKRY